MDEYKIKLCGHVGEQRQYKVVGNPDMPDGDYVIADEAQDEIDELEQLCINIYMSLSVSELHKVTAPVEEAWNKGQKLWLRNTKHKGE